MRRDSLRLENFSYRGKYNYFLTYCTFARRVTFVSPEPVAAVHEQILRAARLTDIAISAYCYMPDHLHLLCEGRSDEADARVFISKSKQLSAHAYQVRYRTRLWQRYAYDRIVSPTTVAAVVRYILGNPVTAGLIERPLDYAYSGSEVWERETLALFMKGTTGTDSAGGGLKPAPT